MENSKIATLTFCTLSILFLQCNNAPVTEIQKTDSTKTTEANDTANGIHSIKAQFIKFELGDASHYLFKDESGKEWDFAAAEVKDLHFEKEATDQETNSENQGWKSNDELIGKWFLLKYENQKRPLYIEGPEGIVPVIIEATPVSP